MDLEKLYFLAEKFGEFSTFFLRTDNKVTLSVFIIIHWEKPFSGDKICILMMHQHTRAIAFSEREFSV